MFGGGWRDPNLPSIMNSLCWNCRGLGNPQTVHALRRLRNRFSLDLVFVSETKISKRDVESTKARMGSRMLLVLIVKADQEVCVCFGKVRRLILRWFLSLGTIFVVMFRF